jgi:putative CocE/NonD family hydrolase
VEWAAHQPWADGKVGMFGGSYVGYTQWAAAVTQPPSLKTIVPLVTFRDPYDIFYTGGACSIGVAVSWFLMAGAQMALLRWQGDEQEKADAMARLIDMADGMARRETFGHLPLADMPLIGRQGIVTYLSDMLSHPVQDDFWSRNHCGYTQMQIPALHIGGWYDIFARNTMQDFSLVRAHGSEMARANQRVFMGPWLHGPLESLVGDVDFGMQASSALVLPDDLQLRWFDYWLKGIDNGIMAEPPVRLFVMGDNCWRNENEWPLARTQYTPFYLHSGGAANSMHGDGSLSAEKPSDEPVDTFVYDPRHPVPTRGGALCCSPSALPPGAYDQREIEARPDVLVYSSAPLERDVEVTGPIVVRLWAATSAPDTDFTAKLVDVGPCGYARNVQDGIVRARCRQSPTQVQAITPGQVYEYSIDLSVTSNVFKAGHRIRVEIASSNFPRFDRNPNTGHPIGQDAEMLQG